MRSGGGDDDGRGRAGAGDADAAPTQVFTVRRAHGDGAPSLDDIAPRTVRGFNRWNAGGTAAPVADIARASPPSRRRRGTAAAPRASVASRARPQRSVGSAQVFDFPVAASSGRAAYVAGTFDTKGRELFFLRQCLEKLGLRVVTVDLATSGKPSTASVHPREVARHHPEGEAAVFSGDRGSAVDGDGARLRALRRRRAATSAA